MCYSFPATAGQGDVSTEPASGAVDQCRVNPGFGFLVSDTGSGYTWAGNSQTNRLTSGPTIGRRPSSEIVYLRHRDRRSLDANASSYSECGPVSSPARRGYTIFEHNSYRLGHELLLLVPPIDPIKLISLKLRGWARQTRKLSVTFCGMGPGHRPRSGAPNVVTEIDPERRLAGSQRL